jgi:hypothetical protein
MKPGKSQDRRWTWLQMTWAPENNEAWMASIQALGVKEMTSKAYMQVHTNGESHEKQLGQKLGPNRAEMGLGRLARADRPRPAGPAHFGSGSAPSLT